MKYKVFIFGTMEESQMVRFDLKENVELLGYLDNKKDCHEKGPLDGVPVMEPIEIKNKSFDYVIISLLSHIQQIKEQLKLLGVPEYAVIPFFFPSEMERKEGGEVIDIERWGRDAACLESKYQIKRLENQIRLWKDNFMYEAMDFIRNQSIRFPIILDTDQVIHKIMNEGCSLCRFGDGEFEIMRGKERPLFQKYNRKLSERLKEVFASNSEQILIGIPDQFGSLERYTDEAAYDIRLYMNSEVRQYLDSVMDYDKTYCDAYLTRPYFIYKDKEDALKRFEKIKQIWSKKNVVIIEGSGTGMGIGNDLLDNSASIQRIIGPAENAFGCYDEILAAAKTVTKDKMFLISLGPSATVLAYDLAKAGYQAVDTGHIDLEYEWFLRNVKERVIIADKYVNEVLGGRVSGFLEDDRYQGQIIARI